MPEESIDVSNLKNIKEEAVLEGAVGYITYLQDAISKGKFKTVEDISKRISKDGIEASGALASHFADKLKIAGLVSGLLEDEKT